MTNYNGFQALYMSFFSKDLYRNVVRNWKGISFLYLFLLVMTSWALISIKIYIVLLGVMSGPAKDLIEKLPEVTVRDGVMKMDKPSPYVVTLPGSSASQLSSNVDSSAPANKELPIAVFDDTVDEVKGREDVTFVVTKKFLYIQPKNQDAQQYPLKDLNDGNMQYTRKQYREFAQSIVNWIPIAVFVIATPAAFAFTAVLVLIFGAIGMAVGGAQNIKLSYGECLRIASVAFTPAIIIDTIIKLIPAPPMPIWGIIPPLLSLGYTIFGVMANNQPIIVETSMPGGMPHTTPSEDDDLAPPDNSTPMA